MSYFPSAHLRLVLPPSYCITAHLLSPLPYSLVSLCLLLSFLLSFPCFVRFFHSFPLFPSFFFSWFTSFFVSMSVSLSVRLPVCLSVYLSIYLSIHLSSFRPSFPYECIWSNLNDSQKNSSVFLVKESLPPSHYRRRHQPGWTHIRFSLCREWLNHNASRL
jgi:hypothetical protein